ncbi:MAG TPA: hypothetical protein VF063_10655 [Gaiellaceae bacterium]
MAKGASGPEKGAVEELLQKLLVVQMFSMGASQEKIAKVVGRQKLWVNGILKGIPRKAADGDRNQPKR